MFAGHQDGEFVGKADSSILHSSESFKFDSGGSDQASGVIIPDAHLLFSGDFKRAGLDLVLSNSERHFVVEDYFKGENHPTLFSPDGASLSGNVVDALTGHVSFAQVGGATGAAAIIGTVVKLTGSATAIRNGVAVELNIGDKVHKGDVVQSGSDSALGISFIDGTAFSLSSNARMVLNDMVYDPNGSSNSSLLSLVQGTISFVAGETAKHGNMRVDTPVATMGIRGTALVVEAEANNGPTKFSIVVEPGGKSGAAVLLHKITGLPIGTVSQPGLVTIVSSTGINQPVTVVELPKTATDLLNERELVKLVFSIAFPQFNFDDANPRSSKYAFGSSVNNLADIGLGLKTANGAPFDLILPGIGKIKNADGSLNDSAAEMLFFLHTLSNASALVEDSVAVDQTLSTTGMIIFPDTAVIGSTATFALKSSTSSPVLPGFINNSQVGSFAVDFVSADLNISTAVGWSFAIEDSNPVLQSLAMGQILNLIYTITLSNGASQDVTVTLIGTNDVATIVSSVGDTPVLTEDSVAANHDLSAAGTITFRDVDLLDTHHAAVALKSSTSTAHLPGFTDNISQIGTFALTSGPLGVSEITTDTGNTATVGWKFTVADNNPVLQSLAKGQTITQIYTVTITDNNGASVTQDVTVTLVGTNDAIIIVGEDLLGSVTEHVNPGGNLTDSGAISFVDVDLTDVHLFSAIGTPVGSTMGTLTVVKDIDSTGGIAGQLTWTYTVADSEIAALAAGQSKVESFIVTLDDQNGSVITKQIDITIHGTNDGATISGAATGSVKEDVTLTAEGTLTVSDIDNGENHFQAVAAASLLGTYGSFTFNPTTGLWGYTLNNAATNVQSLIAGQVVHDTLTVTSADGTASQVINVTITGSNDGATISGTATGAVKEDVTLTAAGTLTVSDVDSGENHFQAVAAASLLGTYGSFTFNPTTGLWGYTLNNAATNVQSLIAGQVVHDTLTVTSADGTDTQIIDVTITGSNDGATISGTATGAVKEDITLTASGTLTVSDVDSGANHFQAVAAASLLGTYGSFTFNPTTGLWGYTLNNAATNVQSLIAGQVVHDTLTVTSADGTASQVINVTITGSNDSATISGTATGAVKEDVTLTAAGTLTVSDVDSGENHFQAVAAASLLGTYGSFTFNPTTGLWGYTLNNAATNVQSLTAGQVVHDTLTVTSADGTASQVINVTITGSNDVPVIGGVSIGAVTEDSGAAGIVPGNLTTGGTLTIADVDAGQSNFAIQAGTAGSNGYGTFTLAANGSWTYTADNTQAAIQQLGATQSLTDSFTAVSSDGTKSQLVTVTIHGTNDVPVISGVSTGAVAEDGTLTTGGTLTIADVDSGQSHFLAVAPASLIGNFGTFTFDPNTGVWGYMLNNAAAESLPTGQVAHDTLTVTSVDGSATKLIDVSITSTNDAPVIQAGVREKVANLAADGGQAVFDVKDQVFFGNTQLTVTDPDGLLFGIAIIGVSNASGQWQYEKTPGNWVNIVLDPGKALLLSATDHVRFLGGANGETEKLIFRAWDGTQGTSGGFFTISELGGSSAFSTDFYVVGAKNDPSAPIVGPAGVAGEPINLGLADPNLVGHTVTVTITDIPADWIVNGGTHNADGSWTVQTTDVASLSVTTPTSFAGAVLLTVTEAVVQADGTTTTFTIGDNLEAYSQGSPIFAWSDNDFLTGSTGNDLFVFGQPIGHDTVYSFDAAHDQIDLIGYTGFSSFADIQAHLTENAYGNAVITLGFGQTIELQGVHAAALTENNFAFDLTPTLDNAGTMTIGDGAMLPLSGTINNTGTISLNSTGDETDLQLIQHGVTLEGGGSIVLSDSDRNIISGTSSSVTLDNEDNTISGAGQLGNGELILTNAGTINATGTHALTIDTGSNWVFNSGVLEASGSGGLTVASSIANSGVLWANGSTITVDGQVTGNGTATIDGNGTLDLEASATVNVVFGSEGAGTLKLGDSFHFNGTITGFGTSDSIDLESVGPTATSISYHENSAGTGGTLAITNGAQTVELSLLGDYSADNFTIAPDQAAGILVSFVPHDLHM